MPALACQPERRLARAINRVNVRSTSECVAYTLHITVGTHPQQWRILFAPPLCSAS